MEETSNKSGMSTGMIIGIAVIVAIVFGGGAYAYVNNKAEKEKKDLNAQITELQSQVSSATTATIVPSSATSATTATDETASWKTYTDSKYGFSVKYPSSAKVLAKDNGGLASDFTDGVVAFEWQAGQDVEADVTLVDSTHSSDSINAIKDIKYGDRYLELRVSKEATSKFQEMLDSFKAN